MSVVDEFLRRFAASPIHVPQLERDSQVGRLNLKGSDDRSASNPEHVNRANHVARLGIEADIRKFGKHELCKRLVLVGLAALV